MANRNMFTGDTYPPLRMQLQQGQQVLDLRPAESIVITFEGAKSTWTGNATALWPFAPDPNGMVRYNMEYTFGSNDTAVADTYKLFVTVTWDNGIQTFSTTDQLIITAGVSSTSVGSRVGNQTTMQSDPLAFSSVPPGPDYTYNQPPSKLPVQAV